MKHASKWVIYFDESTIFVSSSGDPKFMINSGDSVLNLSAWFFYFSLNPFINLSSSCCLDWLVAQPCELKLIAKVSCSLSLDVFLNITLENTCNHMSLDLTCVQHIINDMCIFTSDESHERRSGTMKNEARFEKKAKDAEYFFFPSVRQLPLLVFRGCTTTTYCSYVNWMLPVRFIKTEEKELQDFLQAHFLPSLTWTYH